MDRLESKTFCFLQLLCSHPDRHPGRPGNRAATELFATVAAESGLVVESTELDCVDWERGETLLTVGDRRFGALPGPYSSPCDVSEPLTTASTVDELEAGEFAGTVLLLHGDLCREQLTPRDFPFYEMPGHGRILGALEAARPAAVVAATGRNPELAGSAYPFPLIEDASVEIPNAYLTDVEGERLLPLTGRMATLRMDTRRIPARLQHVVARARGTGDKRVVVFGHVDTKDGTPGALDNATGAAALMTLAMLLRGYTGRHTVELLPLNGEDYYAATGEKRFVADNAGRWNEIALGLNADAAGWIGKPTEVSLYGCDEPTAKAVRASIGRRRAFVEGGPWYQSDHGILLQQGIPAVAVTSSGIAELCATVAHTSRDSLDLVDVSAVAEVARFYADVIASLP
jgi:aminopeptidase YwaD